MLLVAEKKNRNMGYSEYAMLYVTQGNHRLMHKCATIIEESKDGLSMSNRLCHHSNKEQSYFNTNV